MRPRRLASRLGASPENRLPVLRNPYSTFSVKLKVCFSAPLVAVTTTVYLPNGVPGSDGGLVLLVPPPPQAERVRNPTIINDSSMLTRRRLDGAPSKSTPAKVSPPVAPHQPRFSCLNIAVAGAFEVMVRVVVPLPGSEAGLKLHELSEGRPEQEEPVNWSSPAKPFTAVTVRVRVPDDPWVGKVTKVALSVIEKSLAAGEVEPT